MMIKSYIKKIIYVTGNIALKIPYIKGGCKYLLQYSPALSNRIKKIVKKDDGIVVPVVQLESDILSPHEQLIYNTLKNYLNK